MILKLVVPVPEADRSVRRVSVLKWHKSEGDPVSYGDALCDVCADESQRLYRPKKPGKILSVLGKRKSTRQISRKQRLLLRINSSDVGVLREICAPEGAKIEVGGLLAMLITEWNEHLSDGDSNSAETATFRVVTNVIHLNSGGNA